MREGESTAQNECRCLRNPWFADPSSFFVATVIAGNRASSSASASGSGSGGGPVVKRATIRLGSNAVALASASSGHESRNDAVAGSNNNEASKVVRADFASACVPKCYHMTRLTHQDGTFHTSRMSGKQIATVLVKWGLHTAAAPHPFWDHVKSQVNRKESGSTVRSRSYNKETYAVSKVKTTSLSADDAMSIVESVESMVRSKQITEEQRVAILDTRLKGSAFQFVGGKLVTLDEKKDVALVPAPRSKKAKASGHMSQFKPMPINRVIRKRRKAFKKPVGAYNIRRQNAVTKGKLPHAPSLASLPNFSKFIHQKFPAAATGIHFPPSIASSYETCQMSIAGAASDAAGLLGLHILAFQNSIHTGQYVQVREFGTVNLTTSANIGYPVDQKKLRVYFLDNVPGRTFEYDPAVIGMAQIKFVEPGHPAINLEPCGGLCMVGLRRPEEDIEIYRVEVDRLRWVAKLQWQDAHEGKPGPEGCDNEWEWFDDAYNWSETRKNTYLSRLFPPDRYNVPATLGYPIDLERLARYFHLHVRGGRQRLSYFAHREVAVAPRVAVDSDQDDGDGDDGEGEPDTETVSVELTASMVALGRLASLRDRCDPGLDYVHVYLRGDAEGPVLSVFGGGKIKLTGMPRREDFEQYREDFARLRWIAQWSWCTDHYCKVDPSVTSWTSVPPAPKGNRMWGDYEERYGSRFEAMSPLALADEYVFPLDRSTKTKSLGAARRARSRSKSPDARAHRSRTRSRSPRR